MIVMPLRLRSIIRRTGHKKLREMRHIFRKHLPVGRKVDFIIAGTQKGGTTALTTFLRQHPNICMPTIKELHFFDCDENFLLKAVDYTQYHSQFTVNRDTLVFGESTPIYMYWQPTFERVRKYNAEMKTVILLRNPIERAYSHWNMEHSRGADDLCFSEAIRAEEKRILGAAPLQHRVYSYIDRGYYDAQIKRIWSFFPRSQVLVLKSDDLRADPQCVLERIARFLCVGSVRTLNKVDAVDAFVGKYNEAMSSEEWDYLAKKFEPSIRELEKMLDWKLDGWLARTSLQASPAGGRNTG